MGKKRAQGNTKNNNNAGSPSGGKGGKAGGKGDKPLSRAEQRKLEEQAHVAANEERKRDNQVRGAIKRARERGKWRADDIECRKEMVAFSKQRAGVGLKIRSMVGDGNCLFRSLADQLISNASKHPLVRQTVVEHLDRNREVFEPFVEDDKPWPRYVSDMRKDACWGGNLELQAASVHYEVNISIHQLGEPMWQVVNWPDTQRLIHLSYHDGDHYNSVHPLDPTDVQPTAVAPPGS